MIFRPFYYDTGCAAYVFGCGGEGIGAVVDPQANDVDTYLAFADAKGLKIAQVVDTHVHADHTSGARTLLSLDRNAFIDAVSVVPERPADMAKLMKINRGLA